MDDADLQEIERFYQNLSTLIRLHGAEHLGQRYVVVRLGRVGGTGPLHPPDPPRGLGRIVDHRSWYPAFRQEAEEAERLAERFAVEGRSLSAADQFHRASACYHWGAYLARFGSSEKAEGRSCRVRRYREAVSLWGDRIRPRAIPYRGTEMPGSLHLTGRGGP